jgi:hypothetical protein
MLSQRCVIEAEIAQYFREDVTRVIANEQDFTLSLFIDDSIWRRISGPDH